MESDTYCELLVANALRKQHVTKHELDETVNRIVFPRAHQDQRDRAAAAASTAADPTTKKAAPSSKPKRKPANAVRKANADRQLALAAASLGSGSDAEEEEEEEAAEESGGEEVHLDGAVGGVEEAAGQQEGGEAGASPPTEFPEEEDPTVLPPPNYNPPSHRYIPKVRVEDKGWEMDTQLPPPPAYLKQDAPLTAEEDNGTSLNVTEEPPRISKSIARLR